MKLKSPPCSFFLWEKAEMKADEYRRSYKVRYRGALTPALSQGGSKRGSLPYPGAERTR